MTLIPVEQFNAHQASQALQAPSGNPDQNSNPQQGQDNPLVSAARTVAPDIMDMTGVAQAPGRAITGQPNPFFTQAQKEGFKENPLGQVAGSAGTDIGTALLRMFAILTGAYGSKSGLANTTTNTAQRSEATAAPETLANTAQDAAASRYGGQGVPAAMKQLLLDRGYLSPQGGLNTPPDLDMSQVLQGRRQLQTLLPNAIQSWFQAPTDQQRAVRVLQSVLSDTVHQGAPATKLPDALYSLFSKVGGDLPSLVLKALGIGGIAKLLGIGGAGGSPYTQPTYSNMGQ